MNNIHLLSCVWEDQSKNCTDIHELQYCKGLPVLAVLAKKDNNVVGFKFSFV